MTKTPSGSQTPNTKTRSAMQEARRISRDPQAKTYADADELFADEISADPR